MNLTLSNDNDQSSHRRVAGACCWMKIAFFLTSTGYIAISYDINLVPALQEAEAFSDSLFFCPLFFSHELNQQQDFFVHQMKHHEGCN